MIWPPTSFIASSTGEPGLGGTAGSLLAGPGWAGCGPGSVQPVDVGLGVGEALGEPLGVVLGVVLGPMLGVAVPLGLGEGNTLGEPVGTTVGLGFALPVGGVGLATTPGEAVTAPATVPDSARAAAVAARRTGARRRGRLVTRAPNWS
jgi:hypothetical protein